MLFAVYLLFDCFQLFNILTYWWAVLKTVISIFCDNQCRNKYHSFKFHLNTQFLSFVLQLTLSIIVITFLAACIVTCTYRCLGFWKNSMFQQLSNSNSCSFLFFGLYNFFKIFIILIVGIFYSFFGQFCPLKWNEDNAELPGGLAAHN